MSSTCVPLTDADNQAVGREDRAMLRSNPSARADARAWAAMLLSLLIFAPHAWAANAINLLAPYIRTLPTLETPGCHLARSIGARPFGPTDLLLPPTSDPRSFASRGYPFVTYRPLPDRKRQRRYA